MTIRRDLDMLLDAIGPVEGLALLDIGCGGGGLSGALTKRGARVAAVDPGEAAVGAAQARAPEADVRLAGAEALPFDDGAFDAAIFQNSLHHVPVPKMDAALREAARVTRPGGKIIVMEPLAEGAYFLTMQPISDETLVRAAADAALRRVRTDALALVRSERYLTTSRVPGIEDVLARSIAVDPERAPRVEAQRERVTMLFGVHARAEGDGWMLDQPMEMTVFDRL